MFHLGRTTASCFTNRFTAALDCPYAYPPGLVLLKPAIELVTTTCDPCFATPTSFPLPRSGRNAMVVYHAAATFISNVLA